MPANGWTRSRAAAVMIGIILLVSAGFSFSATTAAQAAVADSVKYYEVADSHSGMPENLSEIALRFLGSSARVPEIFGLNVGRTQPDGGHLTDANTLHKGWFLVLPWDAVGDGVRQGDLPTNPTGPAVTTPAPITSITQAAGASSSRTPAAGQCARRQNTVTDPQPWAQLRLAPQQAWSHGRGDGVTVAVVDSGVDAEQPQLAGRVAGGADIVHGSGRGDSDCLGSGTAMAGLIAAQGGGAFVGIAPGSTILPIRLVTGTPSATVADQAKAIDGAVSAGASVVALGSFVDISQPQVRQAVTNAAKQDVVIVACASTGDTGAFPGQVIQVGAVGIDGRLAQEYPPGSVDVTSPGVDITSLGVNGTGQFRGSGTQYAVALVAGVAALLRGFDKDMPAGVVVELIAKAASPLGNSPRPDPAFGWGLIDPAHAVALAERTAASTAKAASRGDAGGVPTSALIVALLVALIVTGLLVFRLRRPILSRRAATVGPERPAAATPDTDPPPHYQPPGWATGSVSPELRPSSELPRRTPAPRPIMAFDGAATSTPAGGESAAAARVGSRGRLETVEIAPVRSDLL